MKTLTTLTSLFTSLSGNTSTANQALGQQLISDQHRYLNQKYFDNERTYYNLTVGAEDLELTQQVSIGNTDAILTSTWLHDTATQLVVFPNSEQRSVLFTQNSTRISWTPAITVANSGTTISTVGVQAYAIPATVSKIKNDTITVGQLVYTPAPIQSIQEWTQLNALPYTSDIPAYFYIYNNQVNFFPIPSSSGNVITFNYKSRVPDLSFNDYSTGTVIDLTEDSNFVTGDTTAWSDYPQGVNIGYFNLFLQVTPPDGEGIWYPIQRFNSDTELLLATPIQNAPSGSGNYIIGQLPLLEEDFHDMLVYGALMTYYATIVPNPNMYKQMEQMYISRLQLLEQYAGTKSVNVDLGQQPFNQNPNLFLFYPTH